MDEQRGGELIKSKVKADRSLRERLQPRLGLLEIGRVKALGIPCVDLSQQVGSSENEAVTSGNGVLNILLSEGFPENSGGRQKTGEGLVARGTMGKPVTFFFTENGTDPISVTYMVS